MLIVYTSPHFLSRPFSRDRILHRALHFFLFNRLECTASSQIYCFAVNIKIFILNILLVYFHFSREYGFDAKTDHR